MSIPAFAVITGRRKYDLELQIICTTKASAQKEVRDLKRDFGMEDARVKEFEDEGKAYEWFEANQ